MFANADINLTFVAGAITAVLAGAISFTKKTSHRNREKLRLKKLADSGQIIGDIDTLMNENPEYPKPNLGSELADQATQPLLVVSLALLLTIHSALTNLVIVLVIILVLVVVLILEIGFDGKYYAENSGKDAWHILLLWLFVYSLINIFA
jgi:hypothetical protein